MPKTAITIGTKNTPLYFFNEIYPGNVIWCLEIGLVTQVILVVLTEILTSHAFKPTRDVAEETSFRGAGKGYLTSGMIGNVGVFAILFLIGSLCLWCYIIAGFFGIALGAVGLLSAPIIFLAISISSNVVN